MPTFRAETKLSPFWIMVVLSVFGWAPALYPGYWQSLDGYLPAFNTIKLQRLASVGVSPDLWRGDGVGSLILPHFFFQLGASPVVAVRLAFVIVMLAGGMGLYFWLENTMGNKGAGLGALTYGLLPTLLNTVYIRGALADATILGLLPWMLFTLTARPPSQSKQWIYKLCTALLLTWLWLTQAGLALLATFLLSLFTLFVVRNRWALTAFLVGTVMGVATLIPVLDQNATSRVNFADHFLYFFQLLHNHWQVAPSIAGWQDGFPFQLGTIVVAGSILAFWLWFVTQSKESAESVEKQRLLRFGVVSSILLISLSLTFSAPLWHWSGAERLLTYPWQILLLAAPFLVILPAALPSWLPAFAEIPAWSALLLLTLAGSFGYLTTDFTQILPAEQPLAIVGANQLAVLDAQIDESQPPTVTLNVAWQVLQPLTFDYNIFVQALSDDGPQAHSVAQFDGPPLPNQPATTWSYGEIFTGTYHLQMPDDQLSSPLYIFGYYDWRDGTRLTIDGGKDDKIPIHSQNR